MICWFENGNNWRLEHVMSWSERWLTVSHHRQLPLNKSKCSLRNFQVRGRHTWQLSSITIRPNSITLHRFSLNSLDQQVKRQSDWPPAGVAGVDYPTYDSVPEGLQFSCDGQIAGYFADPATQCQVNHVISSFH